MTKVLIAEDDFMIGEFITEAVLDAGYEVCGIAREPQEALELGERHVPDLAIIDLRLADGSDGVDAAVRLSNRLKIGILYASGNCHQVMASPPPVGEACLAKPYTTAELVQSLKVVEELAATGKASVAIPRKLYLLKRA